MSSIQQKLKEATDFHVTLEEAKTQLRVDDENTADDKRISDDIEYSVSDLETRTNSTIAKTSVTHTITNFNADNLFVYEKPLLSILGISGDTGAVSYTLDSVRYNGFGIKFSDTVSANTLTLEYTLGFDTEKCPREIKKAILLQTNSYYDEIGGEYTTGSWQKNGVIERLLIKHYDFNV